MRIFFTYMLGALLMCSGTLLAQTPQQLTDPNYNPGVVKLIMTLRFNSTATAQQKQQAADSVAALINKCVRNGAKYIVDMQYGDQNSKENVERQMQVAFILTFKSEGDRNFFVGRPQITDATYYDPVHERFKNFSSPILQTGSTCGPNSPDGLLLFSYKPIPATMLDSSCGRPIGYNPVTSPSGKVWLDRNLGARGAALTATDFTSYGNAFQWGRGRDRHECINWTNDSTGTAMNGTTATLSSGDNPGNALFILTGTADWRATTNNNLWQGVNGINNPCPSNYRVPTRAEWEAEVPFFTGGSPFNSVLRVPLSGCRNSATGLVVTGGKATYLWSSTIDPATNRAYVISSFGTATSVAAIVKKWGFGVRCIRD
jgi:hypothetical protein